MSLLDFAERDCPYCGEPVLLALDPSVPEQQYTEDCRVCCRPMVVQLRIDADGGYELRLQREDD